MGRFIVVLAAAIIAVVALGATPAAAFVYSCVPAQGQGGGNTTVLYLYNGQIATANVTVKVLAANGTNLNASLSPALSPQTFTIAAGVTRIIFWAQPACSSFCYDTSAGTNASTVPANVRVVTDQELGVGLNILFSGDHPFPCTQVG
jgi:hypothetical protein